ncbi:MAG: acyl-CoA thioesterase [Candidatus Hydrogenedentes bacterium]|nr:acyl-CoA thioesterase [Candidatus Hydrogenedentota bacterium]
MFVHTTTVTMHDADAAGILFFARHFAFAHDAYEAFLASRSLGFARMLSDETYITPLVHAESDYKIPLHLGERVTVHLHVESIRKRKFCLRFELRNREDRVACEVRTTHVALDKGSRRAVPLPEELVHALEACAD